MIAKQNVSHGMAGFLAQIPAFQNGRNVLRDVIDGDGSAVEYQGDHGFAGGDHGGEHFPRPAGGGDRIDARGVARGGFGEPGQQGGLPEVHVAGGDAEIEPRRRIHPPGAGAEIDAVEPDLQNFLLGEMVFEPQGQHQFLHLALGGAGGGEEQVFRHLLGDGGAALHQPAGEEVDPGGAGDADQVDAEMPVKPAIFHRDGGRGQGGGQV